MWQFQNASAQSVSTLSEHFQSHWGAFTYSNTAVPTRTLRIKCGKRQLCMGSSFSRYEISDRQISPEVTSRTTRLSPHVVVCSVHKGKASCDRPSSVCTQSQQGPFTYSPCPSAGHGLTLEEVNVIQFFFFFCFLQLRFSCSSPQNRFSSKIAIKSLWKFISIVAAIASRLLLSCSRRRASSLCWSSGFCVVG